MTTNPAEAPVRSATEDQRGKIAMSWWAQLRPQDVAFDPEPAKKRSANPGDRAAIARLKRASLFEAAADPATLDLFTRLSAYRKLAFNDLSRVAVLAGVLPHIKEHQAEPIARTIGKPRGGDVEAAVLKPLRLRRLMTTAGDDDLLIAFRRLVALADGKTNVAGLATLVLDWDRDEIGDRTRTRFAFDYYDAGDHAPALADPSIAAKKD